MRRQNERNFPHEKTEWQFGSLRYKLVLRREWHLYLCGNFTIELQCMSFLYLSTDPNNEYKPNSSSFRPMLSRYGVFKFSKLRNIMLKAVAPCRKSSQFWLEKMNQNQNLLEENYVMQKKLKWSSIKFIDKNCFSKFWRIGNVSSKYIPCRQSNVSKRLGIF